MKKKILALCLVVVLAVTAVTGATLAYFTDTDAEENVFTVGKVDIDLKENFDEENAKLFPGKENAIQKEVFIELEAGSEDAYVWYTWMIPATLDTTDGRVGTDNKVHVNAYGYTWDTYRENSKYWPEGVTSALPKEQTWDHDPDVELSDYVGPEGLIGQKTIDGIVYNVYLSLYHGKLSHAEGGQTKTSIAMSQVWMDHRMDAVKDKDGNTVAGQYTLNGEAVD